MTKARIIEFDKTERLFSIFIKDIEFNQLPSSNDKLVIDIDHIGYIFKIYDVHYAENNQIDINVIRISTITAYNSSKFPDIKG